MAVQTCFVLSVHSVYWSLDQFKKEKMFLCTGPGLKSPTYSISRNAAKVMYLAVTTPSMDQFC